MAFLCLGFVHCRPTQPSPPLVRWRNAVRAGPIEPGGDSVPDDT